MHLLMRLSLNYNSSVHISSSYCWHYQCCQYPMSNITPTIQLELHISILIFRWQITILEANLILICVVSLDAELVIRMKFSWHGCFPIMFCMFCTSGAWGRHAACRCRGCSCDGKVLQFPPINTDCRRIHSSPQLWGFLFLSCKAGKTLIFISDR